MPATMTVSPDAVWSDPGIDGFDVSDTEWRLDVDRYRDFLVEATGISPADGLSPADCYRIGNRLQALVEERKRHREWVPALVEAYPDVDSLEAFLWLARFFRACHDCTEAGETVVPGREPGECAASR
jgi:hypothetical protein